MTLSEFKRIWLMEFAHRQWGRLIGTVFAVPAIAFWAKGYLNSATKKRVLAFGTLIGLQVICLDFHNTRRFMNVCVQFNPNVLLAGSYGLVHGQVWFGE